MHISSIGSVRKKPHIYLIPWNIHITMRAKRFVQFLEHRDAPCGSCGPKNIQVRTDVKRTTTETIRDNMLSVRPTPTGGNEFSDQANNPDYSSGSLGLCSTWGCIPWSAQEMTSQNLVLHLVLIARHHLS